MLLLLLCTLPLPDLDQTYQADLIELNHVYHGENCWWHQYIVWEWRVDRFYVRDWCTLHHCRMVHTKEGFELHKREYDSKRLWIIKAPDFRETWTLTDSELEHRKVLKVDNRNLLWNR